MHIQNQPSSQSYQPAQSQNPAIMHSYQPTQMQNEIPLPYYLQQKSTYKFFTNAKSRRITTNYNESIPNGWIIKNIK